MAVLLLSNGTAVQVDANDVPALARFKWHLSISGGGVYAYRNARKPDRTRTIQRLHTFLTGWSLVDHRNGDTLDNRRENLRPATPGQNAANRGKQQTASPVTSRFKGVSWFTRDNCWRANIRVDGVQRHLGLFDSDVEAAVAYDRAAVAAWGDFARPNFPAAKS